MSVQIYSELDLRKMKTQALKDVWHALIGKPPGLKNTTGLRTSEEILQAILKAQADPTFRPAKEPDRAVVESMPPKEKKKPGPKPKPPSVDPVPVVSMTPQTPAAVQAVESTELPLAQVEVKRIRLKKLMLGQTQYYLEEETFRVYEIQGRTPGDCIGTWNPTTQELS